MTKVISFGENIKRGFLFFCSNFGAMVKILLFQLFLAILSIGSFLLLNASLFGAMVKEVILQDSSNAQQYFGRFCASFWNVIQVDQVSLFFLSLVIVFIVWSYLRTGSLNYMLRLYDARKVSFKDFFPSFDRVVKLGINNIVSIILPLIIFKMCGLNLCNAVAPYTGAMLILIRSAWAFIMLRFCLVSWLLIDRNIGIIEAYQKSFELTKGYGYSLLLFVSLEVIASLFDNAWLSWLRLLFLIPIMDIIFTQIYRQLSPQEEQATE